MRFLRHRHSRHLESTETGLDEWKVKSGKWKVKMWGGTANH